MSGWFLRVGKFRLTWNFILNLELGWVLVDDLFNLFHPTQLTVYISLFYYFYFSLILFGILSLIFMNIEYN